MDGILLSLQITLVGMGLVFAALIFLWGLMEALVRISAERETPEAEPEASQPMSAAPALLTLKQQAAAAAVALALEEKAGERQPLLFPPLRIVSAWQVVMRTNMLNKQGKVR